MASYLSLNADEAYKLGGRYNGESNASARRKVTTYSGITSWASNHGLAYRNVTGFSGSTRVAAKADVYLSGSPSHTDNVLALGTSYNNVSCGRYAMAGPLIGDTTGGSYQDTFPFHIYPLRGTGGDTVPNPYAHGEITTQGEFSYGNYTVIWTETEPPNLQNFSVQNGYPKERGNVCPNSANTIRVNNFLAIDLGGADITSLRSKKYGFICGNSPDSVAYVANKVAYPSNTQHFHVGTGVTFNSFVSVTGPGNYTKVTFGDPATELIIPPQTALERVGCNTDGFMLKFKSNAAANTYGYEVIPFAATVGGRTYWQIIQLIY